MGIRNKMFMYADENRDKKVSIGEFTRMQERLNVYKGNDEMKTMFDSIDKDSDMFITLEELKEWRHPVDPKPPATGSDLLYK